MLRCFGDWLGFVLLISCCHEFICQLQYLRRVPYLLCIVNGWVTCHPPTHRWRGCVGCASMKHTEVLKPEASRSYFHFKITMCLVAPGASWKKDTSWSARSLLKRCLSKLHRLDVQKIEASQPHNSNSNSHPTPNHTTTTIQQSIPWERICLETIRWASLRRQGLRLEFKNLSLVGQDRFETQNTMKNKKQTSNEMISKKH